jgi:hypothetical protein
LECAEAFLVHQQAFLPISKGEVGLVSTKVIALTTYLGSLGLIALIVASRFLQNDHLFLLGVIGANSSSPFPFQAHLRWAYDLLLVTFQTSIPPFEQL